MKGKSCWLEVVWWINPALCATQSFEKFEKAVEFAKEKRKQGFKRVEMNACYSNGYTLKIEERFYA